MVSSPEISRLNGSRSRGPVTKRGKTIASRNATKHGLLVQKPPLLVTEDLETFEGLVQGLIEQYQPETPVEHFLVQQVAMGMLKQYRLWSVEAAIANVEILKAQRLARFPDVVTPAEVELDSFDKYREKRTPCKQVLEQKKRALEALIHDLAFDLAHKEERGEAKTLEAFRDSLSENYSPESKVAEVERCRDEFDEWLCASWNGRKRKYTANLAEAIVRVERLIELAGEQVAEIDQALAEMATVEEAIAQASTNSKGVQNPERFMRYQREMNRDLYEALDRLQAIQQQRNNEGSIGSFR
ncbi:hypothetical protein [Trichocoleus sp. FACHB-262]|uniref:hypothetical protein n=1 Tax=Trichocoleus sp. FACHB-262 TaxID=2692869 RepID=UPI0016852661|nr:hypothetical protein [Trichocoleus sp. FACHB-262]MBD2122892.1 hypothetical protein [Trichocoleus sp. FACHB-262]